MNSTLNDQSKARLLSVASAEAGTWLNNVLPVPSLNLMMSHCVLHLVFTSVLQLLLSILTYVCGATVDTYGTYGLSCQRSGGRLPCHASVNETIRRTLVSGVVPAVLEPVGVCRDDGKRPDGMSLIPWRRGLLLLWDFTCSDTLAPFHLATSVRGAGRLVDSSEAYKRRKYSSLTVTFHFSPVCRDFRCLGI